MLDSLLSAALVFLLIDFALVLAGRRRQLIFLENV